jgi:hypothetical protein
MNRRPGGQLPGPSDLDIAALIARSLNEAPPKVAVQHAGRTWLVSYVPNPPPRDADDPDY